MHGCTHWLTGCFSVKCLHIVPTSSLTLIIIINKQVMWLTSYRLSFVKYYYFWRSIEEPFVKKESEREWQGRVRLDSLELKSTTVQLQAMNNQSLKWWNGIFIYVQTHNTIYSSMHATKNATKPIQFQPLPYSVWRESPSILDTCRSHST